MQQKNSGTQHYPIDYEVGQDNVEIMGMDIHNPVFFLSSLLIILFVTGTIIYPEGANTLLNDVKAWCLTNFDWFLMGSANFLLLFCIGLAASPFGRIRLGGAKAQPDFSRMSWFSMLFAAGMGIGLMFWGVAEPMAYFSGWGGTPFAVEAFSDDAAALAIPATLYHWGFHAWSIYAVVGLALAFFYYNKGMPLTIRSVFYPLFGDRVWGWLGHGIDILAVLATIFGLATSLGLGASQVSAGLNFLFGIPDQLNTKIGIVIGVTFIAVISVFRGLEGGVKVLSNINMLVAFLLFLFVFFAGPTQAIVNGILATTGTYIAQLIPLSLWSDRPDTQWMQDWTVFYWAWWVSWSPFVGMFIARISKGRTLREFIIAVLLVPVVVTLLWMSTFGVSALVQAQNGIGELANGLSSPSLATFQMLQQLPLAQLTTGLGIMLVMVFFVTSSDSGSLVIDSITAGGKLDAPIPQRIFWAVMGGLIAGTLLFGGGKAALSALQAGAIATGLPFTLVLLTMCGSLIIGLSKERSHLPKTH
ncbi:BCCT family transporter [Oceanicoccus sagamiensis]|uniref:Glycine/betaine ABC transporter n=1 Tax=Oceanicoccus sagamiensis TaxID=716816 RepID=A0A1X9N9N2_9GAMM|nr:BCCT family transporter [Oceanicoccus sagamiensis]ARN73142.1 glycine/betaine ABC transporter [Oceanicoccus sagamiensis]